MILSSAPQPGVSPAFVEGCLTVIAIGLAFAFPRMGYTAFRRIERVFGKLARRRGWAVASVGVAAFVLRLAILPFCPIPLPFVPDDFSFLLAADTFAHGRLTNPTPAMWMHFESIHITMVPSYMSMYFPMPSLVLAAGQVVTGHPWFGLLFVTALMCAAICWMLQAWLPPGWALLGGVLAILRLGLFSYWIDTYNGGGSVAALGGALVLGAFPRLMRNVRLRDGMILAAGIDILLLSRPYEGLLLCLPVAFVLGRWILFGKSGSGQQRPATGLLIRRAALPLLLVLAAGAWLAYYDYRAFGSPTTLPYTVDRATYAIAPYFIWQSVKPEPAYRNQAIRNFYTENELSGFTPIHSIGGLLLTALDKAKVAVLFFAGTALLPPLLLLKPALTDRRTRFVALCILFALPGLVIQRFLIPHYLAPFTVVFYVIGLQAMRHLRFWKPEGRTFGVTALRFTVTICLVSACLRPLAGSLHLSLAEWPLWWYGPAHRGVERARVLADLEKLPGKQLVLVRYSAAHNSIDEWVYNSAELESSKVIWAREMSPSDNVEILHFYKDRQAWLVQPDRESITATPYPSPPVQQSRGAS